MKIVSGRRGWRVKTLNPVEIRHIQVQRKSFGQKVWYNGHLFGNTLNNSFFQILFILRDQPVHVQVKF